MAGEDGEEGGRPEHGHKLKLLVWNVHSIGGRSADANAELKITDVCSMIKLHDIAVLTETRTSDALAWLYCAQHSVR